MKLKIKKFWYITNEFINCLKNRVKPQFFLFVILKKFPQYASLFPFGTIWKTKARTYLPPPVKRIPPLLRKKYNIKEIYDVFVSFFFFEDFVPKEGWMILDGGAYQGIYTEICSYLIGRKGRVLAVEPNPDMYAFLRQKFGNNEIYSNVEIVDVALGEGEKNLTLYTAKNFSSASSIYQNHVTHFSSNYTPTTVQMWSLDILAEKKEIKHLDLVKLDIEGAELNALLGAMNSIKSGLIKRFIIEVHEDVVSIREIIKLLLRYHYKIKVVINTSAIVRRYIYAKCCG